MAAIVERSPVRTDAACGSAVRVGLQQPGDQLRLEVDVLNWRTSAARLEGKAYIDGKLACEAVILCAVVLREPQAARAATAPAPEPQPLEAVVSE